MASSTFFGLQTSLRGLLAHQRSLDVTGHNVANASTVGYSRQEAVLTSSLPQIVDRKSTRLNSSHANISYAVFCLKKKKKQVQTRNSYNNTITKNIQKELIDYKGYNLNCNN